MRLDGDAAEEVLLEDPLRGGDIDAVIPRVLGIDDDHRTMTALPRAAGVIDADALADAGCAEPLLQQREGRGGVLGGAGLAAGADEDVFLELTHEGGMAGGRWQVADKLYISGMTTSTALATAFVMACTPAFAPLLGAQTAVPTTIALTHANIVDGRSATVVRDATILIRGGRIQSIRVGASAPADATVLDLQGRWVAPGLIDAHTHLSTLGNARRALLSGVTTVRSASVPAYQDVAMRAQARAGEILAPDVLATGVFVSPSLGETVLADARLGALAGGVHTPAELRALVRVNLDHGVDWIKTRGTERAGLPDTDPRKQVYDEAQLRAIVEEAATRNVPVMAHAHGDEGAYAAVAAWVRSIEHGTYLSDSTLRLMQQKRTWLVPTLSTIVDLTQPGGDYDDPVLVLRGQHMAHAAATSGAAELLGIADRTGRIAEGYEADLIVLEGNPLDDPAILQDVLIVITNGRIALNRLPFGRRPPR